MTRSQTCVGFHTRNLPHAAHEYIHRRMLEQYDKLLIQPQQEVRVGDWQPALVLTIYRRFVESFYPHGRVHVEPFPSIPAAYQNDPLVIQHAKVRRDAGCTHFVVGRDHGGTHTDDPYAAHRQCECHPVEGLTIVLQAGPYYCQKCAAIVTMRTCGHTQQYHEAISGTQIREAFRHHHPVPWTRSCVVEWVQAHPQPWFVGAS